MRLKWIKLSDKPRWLSNDGCYEVWLQAHLLHGEREYGALIVKTGVWLTSTATLKEAKELCEEHRRT